jgi:hypothetical protein
MEYQPNIKYIFRLVAVGTLSLALGLSTLPLAAQEQNPAPQEQQQQAPPPQDQGQQDQQNQQPAQQPQDQPPPQQYPQQAPPPQYPEQAPPPANQPPNDQGNYAPVPPSLTLPAGTVISVRSSDWLSSDHNKAGDVFTATLARPLIVNGYVVARRGQDVTGHVMSAEKAGRVKGVSKLGLELSDLTLVDGQILPLKTQLLQGTGGTSNGRDVAAVAGTTGLGAAIGAAAGWGTGAAIGAGAGAAAGIIGVLVTRGRPTVVGPEQLLTFRLHDSVTFSTVRGVAAYLPATQDDYGRPPRQDRPYARRYPYGPYGPPPPPYYPYYYGYGPYPYWGYPPGVIVGGRW